MSKKMNDFQTVVLVKSLSCVAGITIATLGYRGWFRGEWADAIERSADRAFAVFLFAGILAFL